MNRLPLLAATAPRRTHVEPRMRHWDGRSRRDLRAAILFLTPALLALFTLQIVPLATAVFLAFCEWDIVSPPVFIGLRNFHQILDDTTFYKSLGNTFHLTVLLELGNTSLGLLTALLLNAKIRGLSLFRTIYFLPLVTTWAAVAIAWKFLYSQNGPINAALARLGFSPVSWLSQPETALNAVIITIVWKTIAWKMIILLAGLQAISPELYEASSIDGAGRVRTFTSITLPLLTPSLFFALVVGMINTLQLFDPIYIMTQGGPADATKTLSYYIYFSGFKNLEMGYAASLSWFLFLIILLFTAIQFWLQHRWVFYQ